MHKRLLIYLEVKITQCSALQRPRPSVSNGVSKVSRLKKHARDDRKLVAQTYCRVTCNSAMRVVLSHVSPNYISVVEKG